MLFVTFVTHKTITITAKCPLQSISAGLYSGLSEPSEGRNKKVGVKVPKQVKSVYRREYIENRGNSQTNSKEVDRQKNKVKKIEPGIYIKNYQIKKCAKNR